MTNGFTVRKSCKAKIPRQIKMHRVSQLPCRMTGGGGKIGQFSIIKFNDFIDFLFSCSKSDPVYTPEGGVQDRGLEGVCRPVLKKLRASNCQNLP